MQASTRRKSQGSTRSLIRRRPGFTRNSGVGSERIRTLVPRQRPARMASTWVQLWYE